jgi:hypothetical protein
MEANTSPSLRMPKRMSPGDDPAASDPHEDRDGDMSDSPRDDFLPADVPYGERGLQPLDH